ncbi:E3 ubiquitin-protein ligase TRIM11-like [Macrotis lagotis]|uniref:E3 ubiquitin-protein ligase TRIM11-like n=1 Tax=Macrotis lagotis TaxID=92651 RepID=UPI003D69CE6A
MTSSPEPIQDLQKELTCPICQDFFINPVSIDCGHNFCQCCLLGSWQEASTVFSCPECKNMSQLREYRVNVRLGKLATIARHLKTDGGQCREGYTKCEVHQKVKVLFCEDDLSPICMSCSQSQEHKAHSLHYIDKAAENVREKFQKTVTALWRKSEVVIQQINKEKITFALLKMELEIQKKNILSEFRKIIRFLHEEKDVYLSNLQTKGMISLEGLRKRISELSHQSQELRKRITELEDECKKPDLDLLQDVKGILNRNEVVLQKDIEVIQICVPIRPIPGIMEWLFNLKVDITLDRNTADPGLIISEDLKSVRYGGIQEEVPNNSRRLTDFPQVLGTQSFISGRYYWEVDVPDDTAWCVGICKKSTESRYFFLLRNMEVNGFYYLYAMAQNNLNTHVQFRQFSVPDLKVGIFLDYENGEISFYQVKNRYLIYTFPTISFSGSLVPFFCLSRLTNDCSLTICP